MARDKEPCLCGAPDCRACFPGSFETEPDEDEQYEIERQREIDDK